MSVLDSIKGNFFNVKSEIITGLKNLVPDNTHEVPKCNKVIGDQLLYKFFQWWTNIHNNTETLSKESTMIEKLIYNLYQFLVIQSIKLKQFHVELISSDQLILDVNKIQSNLEKINLECEKIEISLNYLEDINEDVDFNSKKIEFQNRLSNYKKQQQKILQKKKDYIIECCGNKIKEKEEKQNMILKERQQIFEQVHLEEMENYKKLGQTPDYIQSPSEVQTLKSSLENISIEVDSTELDKFLEITNNDEFILNKSDEELNMSIKSELQEML